MQNKNRVTQSKFLVIQEKMDPLPLLSKSTLLEPGIQRIDPEGTLRETNELRIKTVKHRVAALEQYWTNAKTYFKGLVAFGQRI